MRRTRLNLIEVAIVCVLVGVLAYVVARYRTEVRLRPFLSRTATEVDQLEAKYGPGRNSRYAEEWMIRDFFNDTRGGVFVDVGANHYQKDSNTYYLETALGWSGIAVEPQAKFAADYASHRPRTKFIAAFASDSKGEVTLHVPANDDLVASSNEAFVREEGGRDVASQSTPSTTLDDLLESNGIGAIDFLSIDVELHEPAVLKGFSIDVFKPKLVAIEAHPQVRQQILDYFAAHRYVIVAKYLRADSENLWFMPAPS